MHDHLPPRPVGTPHPGSVPVAPPPPGARPTAAAWASLEPGELSDPSGIGPVAALELALANALAPDVADVRTAASGTGALALALLAAGGGRLAGRTVLVSAVLPPYVRGTVDALGGRAIPVDAGWPSFGPTADALAAAARDLSAPDPVALVVGSGLGIALDLDASLAFAARTGCLVIEDAAASLGARDGRGHPAGTQGHFGVFSLAWGKSVPAGEGGVLVAHSAFLAKAVDRLFPRPLPGASASGAVPGALAGRLSGVGAALALAGLDTLDARLAARRQVAGRVRDLLSGLPPGPTCPEVRVFDGPDASGTCLCAARFPTLADAHAADARANTARLDFPALPCSVPADDGVLTESSCPDALDGHRRVRLLTWWDSGAASPAEIESLLPAVAYTLTGR